MNKLTIIGVWFRVHAQIFMAQIWHFGISCYNFCDGIICQITRIVITILWVVRTYKKKMDNFFFYFFFRINKIHMSNFACVILLYLFTFLKIVWKIIAIFIFYGNFIFFGFNIVLSIIEQNKIFYIKKC